MPVARCASAEHPSTKQLFGVFIHQADEEPPYRPNAGDRTEAPIIDVMTVVLSGRTQEQINQRSAERLRQPHEHVRQQAEPEVSGRS